MSKHLFDFLDQFMAEQEALMRQRHATVFELGERLIRERNGPTEEVSKRHAR
jgi:hypothetical protein